MRPGAAPLAGPVVAAAVILDDLHPIRGLADSKVLTPRRRERLFDEIRAKALCCSIAEASVEEIDRLNILQATLLAMRRAVEGLRLLPQQVLVDGNRLPVLKMPAEAIVKGDAKVPAISAASILAKVQRDRLCAELHLRWPDYGFDGHKGYHDPRAPGSAAPPRRLPGAPAQLRPGARNAGGLMTEPVLITSRDNPLLVRLRKLTQDPGAYRKLGQVWLEGEHLCAALRVRGHVAAHALVSESAWDEGGALRDLAASAARVSVLGDALFKTLSALESPARIGFLIDAPGSGAVDAGAASVVLDRVQDAGNVGSILRSAAALGVRQVLARKGTAALWSPKVLRAGMGAALRAEPRRAARRDRPRRARWSPPVRTAAKTCATPRCRRPAPGSSATKGRASIRR